MNTTPIVIERTFSGPAARVWRAITNNDEMKEWYFRLKKFKAEPGFEFQFEGGPDDRSYVHLCKITEVIPEKKLRYSWRYDGYEGISFVSFELFPEGNKTRLRLTHEGLETFPSNNKDFDRENFQTGWTDIIGRSLAGFLEKANASV